MRAEQEIRERIERLDELMQYHRTFDGQDVSGLWGRFDDLKLERKTLLWVLGYTNIEGRMKLTDR